MGATIVTFILAHEVSCVVGALYLASAMVGALPAPGSPDPTSTLIYRWFFDFIHTALNQVDKVVASRYPHAMIQSYPAGDKLVVQKENL
jgi:hypothetical protein